MKQTMMIFRLAFVIALLVGLGGLLGFYPMSPVLMDVHIVAGLIALVSAAWVFVETKNPPAGLGALLILVGGLLALLSPSDTLTVRLFHVIIIIVGIGLVEMGVARSQRNHAAH